MKDTVTRTSRRHGWLDHLAIGMAAVCAIHCLFAPTPNYGAPNHRDYFYRASGFSPMDDFFSPANHSLCDFYGLPKS